MKGNMMGNEERGEIVVSEVADMLGLLRPTVISLIKDGSLPARKDDRSGALFVKITDVEKYKEKRRQDQKRALYDLLAFEEEHFSG